MSRILITGSRTWDDVDAIVSALIPHATTDAILISGGCPSGADAIAERVWRSWGLQVEIHPANWRLGRNAGKIRNQEMVDLGADVCLAFRRAYSGGTTHCGNAATMAGIETNWFTVDEDD